VADPDPERRSLLARDGVAAHASVEDLLEAGGVEAVVIASPPEAHEHATQAAAAAGVTTLVEKPPAPDAEGAARIAALNPMPWVGFNRRFALGANCAGLLPDGGTIDLELRYRRFSWAPVSVRDPALTDLAPHLVDLALRAGVGAPHAVSASSARQDRVEIELEGGAGTARIRCACDRMYRESLAMRDADGRLVERRRVGGIVRGLAARVGSGPHPLVASLAAQLDELALAARGETPATLASATEGAAVMRVIAAAADSLAHGGEPIALAGTERTPAP